MANVVREIDKIVACKVARVIIYKGKEDKNQGPQHGGCQPKSPDYLWWSIIIDKVIGVELANKY